VATAVLSDLHLGAGIASEHRQLDGLLAALEGLGGIDRLVLLGDVLELRGSGRAAAWELGRELCRRLQRLNAEELVIVWGNHDHGFARRPPQGWPGNPQLRYPGLWLRADTYATHGHYLDCHLPAPPAERLAVAVAARLVRVGGGRTAARYERAVTPIYCACEVVGRDRAPAAAPASGPPPRRRRLGLRGVARAVAVRLAPGWEEDPAAAEDRALAEAAAALGAEPRYLIYGHTHRAGIRPLSGWQDRYAVNCGSWRWGGDGPQGWCVLLGADGPPRLLELRGGRWREAGTGED